MPIWSDRNLCFCSIFLFLFKKERSQFTASKLLRGAVFTYSSSACNFQSKKSPVEMNSQNSFAMSPSLL